MTYPGMTTEGWGWEEEEDTVFLREGECGWISSLLCLSPRVSFQRTDPDSVVGVSPAVMIRSSSQDSEVSTVVGEHHAGALVGGVWVPFGRGFLSPVEAGLAVRSAGFSWWRRVPVVGPCLWAQTLRFHPGRLLIL